MIQIKRLIVLGFFFNLIYLNAAINYLDTTFGTRGIVTSVINSSSKINGLALDINGNIVAVGNTVKDGLSNLFVSRYTSAGLLDNSFGSNGGVIVYALQSNANAVAIDANNKIIVAGNDGSNNIILLRYTTTGILDSSFAVGGIATLSIGDGSTNNAMVIDNNGKIVVAGNALVNGQIQLFIARFNSNGTIDNSFGINNNGYNTITANAYYKGTALAIDLNSNLIVAGSASTLNGSDFLVARFNTNGQIDTTFNTTGVATTNILGLNQSNAQTVTVDSSNRIVVSGSSVDNSSGNNLFVIVRYNSSGTVDTGFGINSNGIVTNAIGTTSQILASLIDANQKIVVGGLSDNKFAIARYNSNGSLDTTFGVAGINLTSINSVAQINTLALQPDGKILAAGLEIESASQQQQAALVRYNKNNSDFVNITSLINNSSITTKAPILSGTSSAANASVQIFIDNALFATIATDSFGNWTTTANALTIGSHSILVNLIVNSVIVVSDAINFTVADTIGEDTILAYSTVTQTTTTANTFQTITFNNILGNNNKIWGTVGNTTLKYLVPITGKFFITYIAEAGILNSTLGANFNISVRLLKNGTEIPGSQTNTQLNVGIGATGVQLLVNSGIITLTQNDTIQLQYATSSTSASGIIAGQGNGGVKPSVTVNITRLQ